MRHNYLRLCQELSCSAVGVFGAQCCSSTDCSGKRVFHDWLRFFPLSSIRQPTKTAHSFEQFPAPDPSNIDAEDPQYATTPLFASLDRHRKLTERRVHRTEALAMVKRRAKQAGLSTKICNHTGRATGITNFILNGGSLEDAQRIAGHASAKTTKSYDHSDKVLSQTEIERIDYFR